MASADTHAALDTLAAAVPGFAPRARPPVHLWNPPFCGDIDMRIAADGTWFYGGTPIGRPALVRLFASIMRRDPDRFVLVTPVERVGIVVEDAPFLAVAMTRTDDAGGSVLLRTNMDDEVTAGAGHPLRFAKGEAEGVMPYVMVRDNLWAKLTRSVAYELMDAAELRLVGSIEIAGINSGGQFFPIKA